MMNQEWKEQQNKDKTIAEIVKLLKDTKLGQQEVHNEDSEDIKTMLRYKH